MRSFAWYVAIEVPFGAIVLSDYVKKIASYYSIAIHSTIYLSRY